ncbi:hypothetical protein MCOR34_006072 [Pyricularia oryzae]|nr:hypothetical protein MCOR34_006072 [Pyricularia oryzae]KAI6461718.1 hypothetical protein MCOR17_006217 [Pyricularia oryzae]KAI6508536.1 hypothetical protein MCOR13_002115 [Pyricularia oryzae]
MEADENNNPDDMAMEEISEEAGRRIDNVIDSADEEALPDAVLQAGNLEDDLTNAIIKDLDSEAGSSSDNSEPETPEEPSSGPGNAAIAIGVAGATMLFAPALIALPALSLIGFGASGPIAGSIAAAVQSGIGSVVAPSLFATLQSAAMGGYGVAAVFGTVQAAGGVITAASAAQIARDNQRP